MISTKSLLLACTTLVAIAPAFAAAPDAPFTAAQARPRDTAQMIAQAPPPLTPAQIEEEKKKAAPPPAAKPAAPPPPPPPAARPAAPPPPPPAARPAAPPPPPVAHPTPPVPPPAAQPRPPGPPPEIHQRPAGPPPENHQRPERPAGAPPEGRPRPPAPPAAAPPAAPTVAPPAVQQQPVTPPPAAQQRPVAPPPAPAVQGQPAVPQGAPPAAPQAAPPVPPNAQRIPGQRPTGGPGGPGRPGAPPAAAPAAAAPPAAAAVAPPPPPAQVRNANEFIRRGNAAPSPGMADIRQQRQETRSGTSIVIREGDRTIVRDDNRTIIRHNESSRFAIGARNINTVNRGGGAITTVERGGGVRIISFTDSNGRLVRRIRRDNRGRDTVLIDNTFAGALVGLFLNLQPPVVRMPRERYIIEADRADRAAFYDVFVAPPVEFVDQRYTLDQVRYNAPLRDYMRRVDLDVNFESGSWQLTPAQVDRLADVADGLNRAIARNPREVFLIEGHTDAVGGAEDNLSLSDRRAEAVAVALTEQFGVPSENLVTQGYGEEFLKEPTDGPSRVNRRVAIRRITPLIDRVAQR